MATIYGFDSATVKRIAKAVRKVEGQPSSVVRGSTPRVIRHHTVLGRILGNGSGDDAAAHSWEQVIATASGGHETMDGGITGSVSTVPMRNPAYERNGGTAEAGTIVELTAGALTFVASTLSGGISSSSTSFNVQVDEGAPFPTSSFVILVENEYVLVGSRSGDTFSSLTRGYLGTIAVAHSDGAAVVSATKAVQTWEFDLGGTGGTAGGDELLPGRIDGTPTADVPPAHSWTQMRAIGDGEWEEDPDGIVGDAEADPPVNQAYELNGGSAADGDIVWMKKGAGPDIVDGYMDFEGEDNDDNSEGVWASAADTGVSAAPVIVECKIERDRVGQTEFLVGKLDNPASSQNYMLWIDASDKLNFSVRDSGGAAVGAVGTTSLLGLTEYSLKGEWTNDPTKVLKVSVNDVQEGTTPAVTALQAPDAITKFYIARGAATTGNFPFDGRIKDVKVTEAGTVIVDFPLSSIHGNKTDDVGPQELEGTLTGCDWRFAKAGGVVVRVTETLDGIYNEGFVQSWDSTADLWESVDGAECLVISANKIDSTVLDAPLKAKRYSGAILIGSKDGKPIYCVNWGPCTYIYHYICSGGTITETKQKIWVLHKEQVGSDTWEACTS